MRLCTCSDVQCLWLTNVPVLLLRPFWPHAQVPDPTKFPDGFKAVADFIHNLGMMSGLYTAKGPHTCQRRAASCLHEAQDAKNWALWGT